MTEPKYNHMIISTLLKVQNSGLDNEKLSLALSYGLQEINDLIKKIVIEVVKVDGDRDYAPAKKNDLIATTTAEALNNLRKRQFNKMEKIL